MLRLFIILAIGLVPVSGAPIYNRDVRPILSNNCFACHGADLKHNKAGLRLDTPEGAFEKTENGVVAIVPGDPDASEAWLLITSSDPDEIMPPAESHKTLSPEQKEIIRQWIESGAKYEEHWAFIAPKMPALPAGDLHPIDHFIQRALSDKNLKLSPRADRATLLRRLSFDLTGLPPTPGELEAFLADQAPEAYQKQIDRLLASPRFGEHMAVPWLDLARYSDSNGYLHDVMRTGWPWRDWVIDAFNRDMPYDQFTIEQLAGDLLPDATPEQILATAFLRNHPITAEGGTIAEEYLSEYSADRAQTVGSIFLGLTFNCCRCHDHKFDPLPQADFFSMVAYFNSSTERHVQNDTSPAYPPLIEIASPLAPDGAKAKVMVMEEAAKPKPTYILKRGQYDLPDKDRPVSRQPPGVLGPPLKGAPANRLGLAEWLVSDQNPMLARVTVNRMWGQFFAKGLVESVEDFGAQGGYPSHPELLDFLAVEFRKTWSIKQLVRLIVTSETYRQSSAARSELTSADPGNHLLGKFPRKRLSAEQVRDAALFTSGLLVEKQGGPPVKPYQPDGLWREQANNPGTPTGKYVQGKGDDLYRRSLYTFHKRNSPPPSMSIFDAPERTGCSALRMITNTPLQALATMNDEQHLEAAKVLAARTLKSGGSTADRLTSLFRRVTSREPSPEDLRTLSDGLASFQARFGAAPEDAAALLKQGALPDNSMVLLASVMIPDGSKPDADGYAYVEIPPLILLANTEYLIGGQDTNAFWDANISSNTGNAFFANPATSIVASRYANGFGELKKPGNKNPGRWAAGNAKFSLDLTPEPSEVASLFEFDRTKVDDPQDRRGSENYTIGNLIKVGERDIQFTALGLQDADGGAFKGGKVGVWGKVRPKPDTTLDPAEHAAWMLIASTVLNLDETLVRD